MRFAIESMTIRRHVWVTCLAVATSAISAVVGAQAATAPATVPCKDGTTSATTGRGACSHHGGVDKSKTATTEATPAAAATPSTSATAAAVTCKDGTTSTTSGRGACSHHGGVASATASANGAVAPSPAATAAPAPEATPAATRASATTTASASKPGSSETNDPTGAIAKCKDGLYSHSKHHTGTCSRHGGVAQWLDGTK